MDYRIEFDENLSAASRKSVKESRIQLRPNITSGEELLGSDLVVTCYFFSPDFR